MHCLDSADSEIGAGAAAGLLQFVLNSRPQDLWVYLEGLVCVRAFIDEPQGQLEATPGPLSSKQLLGAGPTSVARSCFRLCELVPLLSFSRCLSLLFQCPVPKPKPGSSINVCLQAWRRSGFPFFDVPWFSFANVSRMFHECFTRCSKKICTAKCTTPSNGHRHVRLAFGCLEAMVAWNTEPSRRSDCVRLQEQSPQRSHRQTWDRQELNI